MNLKNIIACFLLITCFSVNTSVYGELLKFKAGDKSTYIITQQMVGEIDPSDQYRSDGMMYIDLTVLSVNEANNSYPIEVEVKMRELHIDEFHQNDLASAMVIEDLVSTQSQGTDVPPSKFQPLIDNAMIFRIEGPFQVKETTGVLAQVNDGEGDFAFGHFGATPWTFELFLTQLFQFAGEDLKAKKSYHANCHQLFFWENAEPNEGGLEIIEKSNYKIKKVNPSVIKATWKGKAELINQIQNHYGVVKIEEEVIWHTDNPMIQSRGIKVMINKYFQDDYQHQPLHSLRLKQNWQPVDQTE